MRTNVQAGIAKVDVCVNVNFLMRQIIPAAHKRNGAGRSQSEQIEKSRRSRKSRAAKAHAALSQKAVHRKRAKNYPATLACGAERSLSI
jgi:hypothetical protein